MKHTTERQFEVTPQQFERLTGGHWQPASMRRSVVSYTGISGMVERMNHRYKGHT